ncbi:type II toxin-antitoxin system Phd/YefM family antitoxin [Methylomagnum sp.]
MDTFTVRDLRERTGQLIRDAEAGELAVVTKHGHPVFAAVPFDERLLRESLPLALARQGWVLLDDSLARRHAERRG